MADLMTNDFSDLKFSLITEPKCAKWYTSCEAQILENK